MGFSGGIVSTAVLLSEFATIKANVYPFSRETFNKAFDCLVSKQWLSAQKFGFYHADLAISILSRSIIVSLS